MTQSKLEYLTLIRKVAVSTINPNYAGWALYSDGNVWYYEYRRKSNEGPLDEFIERVKSGDLKAKLV